MRFCMEKNASRKCPMDLPNDLAIWHSVSAAFCVAWCL